MSWPRGLAAGVPLPLQPHPCVGRDWGGKAVGNMTSGCYSSILGRSLAMAWPTCLQTANVRHPGRGRGRNERRGRWWSKLTVAGILSELALTSTESFVKHILTNVYVHIHFCSEKLVIFPKIHFVLQNVKVSIWSITTFMSCHQVPCDMLRLSCDMSHI